MAHTTELVLIYLTILKMSVSRSQNLDSPCPSVFQYRYDRQIGLYGEVSIIVDPTNFLQMNLQMSIGNAVRGNGKLEMSRPKDVADNMMNHRPIVYHLFFPAWTGIPPKITQILVNGKLICSGSKIPINLVPIITTVNLQHTFRINVQSIPSPNVPPDNNFIHNTPKKEFSMDELPDTRFDFYDNNPPYKPQADETLDEFGRPRRPTQVNVEKNRFNFNPTPPPNRFNFNPTPNGGGGTRVQSPAEVYKTNPFFRNITTEDTNGIPPHSTQPQPLPTQPKPQSTATVIHTNPPQNSPDLSFSFMDDIDVVSKDSTQPIRPFDEVCGQTITTNHLIFDGHVVPRGAYPWLVAIFLVKTTGLNYICSGSLISNRHVVTAAHCVKTDHKKLRPNELVLILGKLNIQKWIPVNGEKIVEPTAIYIHPDYESLTSDADIAIIILSDFLQFTKYIRPICLWRGDTNLERVVGHAGTVVGWGKDESGVLMTEEPKQTNLPVVSQEKCLASNYQFHYITSNRTFCAGFRNGTGPCNGDSGGGFIMKWDGKWMLRGIVSLSISETTTKSCDLSNYVVFCDASKYINWMLSFLK